MSNANSTVDEQLKVALQCAYMIGVGFGKKMGDKAPKEYDEALRVIGWKKP